MSQHNMDTATAYIGPRWSHADLEAGEWLYTRLTDEIFRERTGWAPERCERIVARLEHDRPPKERVVPVVLWMRPFTTFTAPGRYVYISIAAHRVYGPERECAADRWAHELCLAAGYDRERCLELLDVLERHALDIGDDDMVYGPDRASAQELSPDAPRHTRARRAVDDSCQSP